MVLTCIIKNCNSKWYTGCAITFHSFPKSPERRKLWLNVIELKSRFYECAKVCSKHFVETDYVDGGRLKIDACPSLYLGRPSAPSTSSRLASLLRLPNKATTKKILLENLNLNDIVPIDSDAAWISSQHVKQIYTEQESLDNFIALGMSVKQEMKTTQPKIQRENPSNPNNTIIPSYTLTCHTCLAQTATLLSPSLAAAFTQTTGVCVAEAGLPCALCATCMALLAKCIQFRQDSLKAHCVLKKRAEKQAANSSGLIDIKLEPISNVEDFLKIEMSQDSDFENENSITQTSKAIIKGTVKTERISNKSVSSSKNGVKKTKNRVKKTNNRVKTHLVNKSLDIKTFITKDHDYIDSKNSQEFEVPISDIDMSSEDITNMSFDDQDSTNIDNIDTTSEDNIEFIETITDNDFLNVIETQNLSKEEQIAEHERKKERNNYISSKFKCELCYLCFKREETLQTHSVKHTEKCGNYVCGVCKCHFETERKKKDHKTHCHEQKFTCKLCSFTTFSKDTANNHFNYHNGTAAYFCEICNLKFDFPTSLWSHNRIKHPSDYVCGFCGYSFLGPKGLEQHQRRKHWHETIAEDGPRCVDCDIVFSNETAFITHQRISPKHGGYHRNEKNYNVTNNPRTLPNQIERIQMKKLVQQYNDPISCEMCDYKTFSKFAYTTHFKKHHPNSSERSLFPENNARLCHTCGLTFQCPNEYVKHRFNFHGPGKSPAAARNKTFMCDICQKEYKIKPLLYSHITSKHLGWRYACSICKKTFSLRANRDRHYNYVHRFLVKNVKCTICDKYFKSVPHQKYHIRHVHYKIPYNRRPGYQRPNKKREDKSDS